MALQYPPKVGQILVCQYPPCFEEPEMVKKRSVVVISPKFPGRSDLATVVPISATAPDPIMAYHCELPTLLLPDYMQDGAPRWAKCDMVCTLSTTRLEMVKKGRDRSTGKRTYENKCLDLPTLLAVRRAVAAALGINAACFT